MMVAGKQEVDQQEFDAHYHCDRGWEPKQVRDRWASQAGNLAADVREELGTRARLVVKPWGLGTHITS